MSIRLNEDASLVATVRDGLNKTGGYCPCVINPGNDDKCICNDFRQKIADPDFEGWCHCKLYFKKKDSEVAE